MNSKIKKGLGRGLSSLIGETKTEDKTNKVNSSNWVKFCRINDNITYWLVQN